MSRKFPRLVFHQFWTEMSVIQGPKRKYVLDFPFLFWRPKMCGFGFEKNPRETVWIVQVTRLCISS